MTPACGIGLVAVLLGSCTHRQQLSASGAELESAVGERVEVRTREGAELEATLVKGPLGGYRVRIHQPRREIELDQVDRIARRSRGRGALDGLLIGAAVGVVFGVALSAATYDEDDPGFVGPESREGQMLLSGAAWAGIGGLVGAIGGAAGEATIEYRVPGGSR